MSRIDRAALDHAVAAVVAQSDGPGGVLGVVLDGQVIHRHAWGLADPASRSPMGPQTLFPICSISKQFTCALIDGLADDPAALDPHLAGWLPNLQDPLPGIADLANNQSGLRDSWALTVLHGAAHDGVFQAGDAVTLLRRMRRTQFAPGSRYSYANGNFHILGAIAERVADRPLADLYRDRIFTMAGMETAFLAADTAQPLNGVAGHEGDPETGLFAAVNRICWHGDAGIAASLDDMLAWECFIDRTRDDADGIYRRLSRPVRFRDGTPAQYGNGLAHEAIGPLRLTGHGGALRGFRTCRLHAADLRLSVVVMFNHEGDARQAALGVMQAASGSVPPPPAILPEAATEGWAGDFLHDETGLVLRIRADATGVAVDFGGQTDRLTPVSGSVMRSSGMALTREGGGLHLHRPKDNLRGRLRRITGPARPDIAGDYLCGEIGSRLGIMDAGGRFFAAFSGFLGAGPAYPMQAVGEDVWCIRCLRSMDAPAPKSWTLRIHRDAAGGVEALTIGCWLARDLRYRRDGAA